MLIPEMQKRNIRNSHHLPGYTLANKLSLCDLAAPTPSIRIQVQLVTYLQATEILECKTIPCYVQLAKHMAKLSTGNHLRAA
jgi:hypothetical protein